MNVLHAFKNILNSINIHPSDNNIACDGNDPVLPTPYLVGTAGAAALLAVGYAASELWKLKTGNEQKISISVYDAIISQLSN